MDGEAYKREHRGTEGSNDVRISLKRWVGHCEGTGERGVTHEAQTGALVTATVSERQRRCEKLMCPTYSS